MDVLEQGRGGDRRDPRWGRRRAARLTGRPRAVVATGAAVLAAAVVGWLGLTGGGAGPSDGMRPEVLHSPSPAPVPSVAPDPPPSVAASAVVTASARPDAARALAAPPLGRVGGGRLADGTFVYVVRVDGSNARVLDAVSPVRVAGVGVELGWCGGAGVFVDVASGSTFDRFGRYVSGPATHDLGYRRARVSGATLVLGAHVRPMRRSRGVATSPCDGRSIQLAQTMLRVRPTDVTGVDLSRPGNSSLLDGTLRVTRRRTVEFCLIDGDGNTCWEVAGASADLAGGRYPWVLVRECYGRLGSDGRLHDLVVVGSPRQAPVVDAAHYVLVKRVAGGTVTADPVEFLTGDAANQAAAEDGQQVPVEDDSYLANRSNRLYDYRLRTDATFTVWGPQGDQRVSLARWTRAARAPYRLWILTFDRAGWVTAVREQFRP